MKGFLDAPLAIPLLLISALTLLISPFSLDIKIKQIYLGNINYLTAQDVLLSIISTTNVDSITGMEKVTLEILGNKAIFPQEDVSFLKAGLDKIVKSKCYTLELGSNKLAENKENCSNSEQTVEAKIVLPYDPTSPTKLIKKIKLVVK